jgi:hypothetical protein
VGRLGGALPDLLNSRAQDCVAGDLQSCEDLDDRSTPFAEYGRYASTCGGRVQPFTVESCPDLPD